MVVVENRMEKEEVKNALVEMVPMESGGVVLGLPSPPEPHPQLEEEEEGAGRVLPPV